jgi:erythromycin esterase-like protein
MGARGELNVGQLVREHYGRNAVLVGFTTYHGSVTAALDWGAPAERKRVRPAFAGSYEPLERSAEWEASEVPETFPFAVYARIRDISCPKRQ